MPCPQCMGHLHASHRRRMLARSKQLLLPKAARTPFCSQAAAWQQRLRDTCHHMQWPWPHLQVIEVTVRPVATPGCTNTQPTFVQSGSLSWLRGVRFLLLRRSTSAPPLNSALHTCPPPPGGCTRCAFDGPSARVRARVVWGGGRAGVRQGPAAAVACMGGKAASPRPGAVACFMHPAAPVVYAPAWHVRTSTCPALAATCSGVSPSLFWALGLRPSCKKAATTCGPCQQGVASQGHHTATVQQGAVWWQLTVRGGGGQGRAGAGATGHSRCRRVGGMVHVRCSHLKPWTPQP